MRFLNMQFSLLFNRTEDGRKICTASKPAPWPNGMGWLHTNSKIIHIYDDGKSVEMRCDNCQTQWLVQVSADLKECRRVRV